MPSPPGGTTIGPKWSKKMNGPTMRRLALGSTRRTAKPGPSSWARPWMRSSIGSAILFSLFACAATKRHEQSARDLSPFFAPRSIAVVGAGERATSSGGAIMQLLRQAGYGGRVVPVNPRGGTIFGYESVTSIAAIDPPVDLAVIVIRPDAILDAVRECADRDIRNLLILPGGFAEAGPVGRRATRRC